MTLSEIACVCLDVEKDQKSQNVSPEEARAYLEWWASLTPEERLWAEADEPRNAVR